MNLNNIFKNVDTILIYNQELRKADLNFFYFTRLLDAFSLGDTYFFKSKNKQAIVTNEITTQLEKFSFKKTDFDVLMFKENNEKYEILKKLLSKSKKVGISYSNLPVREYENLKKMLPNLEFVDIDLLLIEVRRILDNFEISLIKNAAKLTSEAAEESLNYIKEGMTEMELTAKLTEILMKNGVREHAFPPIIAFGENSAVPHHIPGLRKLKKGDFVLMDFGARYRRYDSDMTRTYVFGKGSEKQKRIYSVVKQAQEIGINALKEGVTGNDVEVTVRKFIDSTEFIGQPNHGIGHGVGLGGYPAIQLGSELVLKKKMVVTMEPGIYLKGFGGVRIEDDVLVKKNGFEVLTFADKKYREI
jgi:Xaa-Pro dipeptidase